MRFIERRIARARIPLPALTEAFVDWLAQPFEAGRCPVLRARGNLADENGEPSCRLSNAA
jgi:hypothetical protein